MHHNTTAHILILTNRCIDCGKCTEACPKGTLGRVSFLKHKHVHVEHTDLCIGCLKCVKACQQKAIFAQRDIDKANTAPDTLVHSGNTRKRFRSHKL